MLIIDAWMQHRSAEFRALRVVPWPWNLPPSDRRYYPLYAERVFGLTPGGTATMSAGRS